MIRISELLKLIKVGGKAMRLMTDEEIEILEKLEKLELEMSEEERKKLVDRLKEINVEETGGHLWLTQEWYTFLDDEYIAN